MKHYIVYHRRDLDGECSGAIVYNYLLQHAVPAENIVLMGLDYGEQHNLATLIQPEDIVYLVDFSFNVGMMVALNEYCHLVWIDHHTSRLQAAEDAGFIANRGQSLAHDSPAAAKLTWRYCYPEEPMPACVRLIATYDAWDTVSWWSSHVLPFQLAMQLEHTEPDSDLWPILFKEKRTPTGETRHLLERGDLIREYRETERSQLYTHATPVTWGIDGQHYRCLTLNCLDLRADFWDEVLDDATRQQYDLLINYGYDGAPAWRVTLSPADRENGPDCSAIAAVYGGGGHAGRAGFCCHYIPFLEPDRDTRAGIQT